MTQQKSKKEWDANLPDTTKWQPRKDASETLRVAFFKHCKSIEQQIILRAKSEIEMNIDNFDSGTSLEDIIREELAKLCPKRYAVKLGVIDDCNGYTVGECDIVIVNDIWFSSVKAGATATSRRFHFPIESVYAVIEVKQSLDYKTLDDAMEKLVTCHRLYRPPTEKGRIVENRKLDDCPHATTNPLYSAIIATGIRPGITMEGLIDRFFAISETLKRKEIVRSLCVLGEGTVVWGACFHNQEIKPALFMNDLDKPIIPIYCGREKDNSPLYHFTCNLLTHLYHSILGAEDISLAYGISEPTIATPANPNIKIHPDEEIKSHFNHQNPLNKSSKPNDLLPRKFRM